MEYLTIYWIAWEIEKGLYRLYFDLAKTCFLMFVNVDFQCLSQQEVTQY